MSTRRGVRELGGVIQITAQGEMRNKRCCRISGARAWGQKLRQNGAGRNGPHENSDRGVFPVCRQSIKLRGKTAARLKDGGAVVVGEVGLRDTAKRQPKKRLKALPTSEQQRINHLRRRASELIGDFNE